MDELMKKEIEALLKVREAIVNKYDFQVGNLVKWKEGLKCMNHPRYRKPMLVVKVDEKRDYLDVIYLDENEFEDRSIEVWRLEPFNLESSTI